MSLTEKQEAFVLKYLECGNAAEAYRTAYDVSESTRDQWLYVEASQLLDHPKISLRLQEVRRRVEEVAVFTVTKAMEELEEARQLALTEAQPGAAVSATNSKTKLLGLDRPERKEITGKDGGAIETKDVTAVDQLKAYVAAKSPGPTGDASE